MTKKQVAKLKLRAEVMPYLKQLDYLSPNEAALYLGIAESTFWNRVSEGKLKLCFLDGLRKIERASLDQYSTGKTLVSGRSMLDARASNVSHIVNPLNDPHPYVQAKTQ